MAAPPSHRARILSLLQLGFRGGAPVGSLLVGYLAKITDVHTACILPAFIMLAQLLFLRLRSQLWQHRS